MPIKLPITITRLEDKSYMAHCDLVRATATGNTPEEAVKNLLDAIKEMVQEFGKEAVFQDVIDVLYEKIDQVTEIFFNQNKKETQLLLYDTQARNLIWRKNIQPELFNEKVPVNIWVEEEKKKYVLGGSKYRKEHDQFFLEKLLLKGRTVEIRPIFHWKDRRVKTRVFLCILAQTAVNKIKDTLKQKGWLNEGKGNTFTHFLDLLYPLNLGIFEVEGVENTIINQLTPEQKKILSFFELEQRYFTNYNSAKEACSLS